MVSYFPLIFLLFSLFPHSSSFSPGNSTAAVGITDDEVCKLLDLCKQAPSLLEYQNCLMMQKIYILGLKASEMNPTRNASESNPTLEFTVDALERKQFYRMYLSEHFGYLDCLDLQCACRHFNGGKWDENEQKCLVETSNGNTDLKKAHRKEIRMMSEDERLKFFKALLELKRSGLYDSIAESHMDPDLMRGAHHGPGFAPWHREYLKRMELALRRIDPDLFLPYWDSSLDSHLQEPRDSIVWTEAFFGKMSDDWTQIVAGPFKEWKMPKENQNLYRDVKKGGKGLFGLNNVEKIAKINNEGILAIPFCHDKIDFVHLEIIHNGVHGYVGGAMQVAQTAPSDPIFFLHHSFIDLIWEEWRQNQQTRDERETQYPSAEELKKCSHEVNETAHFLDAPMTPFNYATMKTGLGNFYTDFFYNYAERPSCTKEQDCGSPFLFCNREKHKEIHVCVSKIRVGGDCARFQENEENPCYFSDCIDGKCMEKPGQEGKLLSSANKIMELEETAKNKTRFCYDAHECCAIWSHFGGCLKESAHLNRWCPGSCGFDGCVLPEEHRNNEWEDRHPFCFEWTYHNHERDECKVNKHWMLANCPSSCKKCGQGDEQRKKCQLDLFFYCRDHFPKSVELDELEERCEKKKE